MCAVFAWQIIFLVVVLFSPISFSYTQQASLIQKTVNKKAQLPSTKQKPMILPPPPTGFKNTSPMVQKKIATLPPLLLDKKPSQPAVGVQKSPVKQPSVAPLKIPQTVPLALQKNIAPTQLPVVAPVLSLAPIDIKIKEVLTRSAMLDRIMGLHDLCALVTSTTTAGEKNNIIAYCKELVTQQMMMHKKELDGLLQLCRAMLKHDGLLDFVQKAIMTQWIDSLAFAHELVDEKNTLLVSLKACAGDPKKNYLRALKAAYYVLQCIGSVAFPPNELDLKAQGSLAYIVQINLPIYFNNRSCSDPIQVKFLLSIVQSSSQNQLFARTVNSGWLPTLQLDNILSTAHTSQKPLEKILLWNQFVKMIVPTTDTYEKQFFCDDLTTFFSDRKNRAVKELSEFSALLALISSPEYKQKKIFEPAQYARFEEWKNILIATQALLNVKYSLSLQQNIATLHKIMVNIAPAQASVEKDLFVDVLSHYFHARGDMQRQNLGALKSFFHAVRKSTSVLAANQLVVLDTWIAELDRAERVTTGTQTYLSSLIAQALATKNVDQLLFVLPLFTSTTSSVVKTEFVHALNGFMTTNTLKTIDKNKFKQLLFMLQKHKIDNSSLLTEAQRQVLVKWLHMLG